MQQFDKDDWIKRCMAAGALTEDHADTLYWAYTDEGISEFTPESALADWEEGQAAGKAGMSVEQYRAELQRVI